MPADHKKPVVIEAMQFTDMDCVCGPANPTSDGPVEECQVHGRPYSEWVRIATDAKVENKAAREAVVALVQMLEAFGLPWETLVLGVDERNAQDGRPWESSPGRVIEQVVGKS